MERKIKLSRDNYTNKSQEMNMAMDHKLLNRKHKLEILVERFKSLSPLDRLEHGYASVTDANGRRVTEVKNVKLGDNIRLTLRSGRIGAKVTEISDKL